MRNRPLFTALLAVPLLATACSEAPLRIDVDGKYQVHSILQTPHGIPEREAPELAGFIDLAGQPDRVEEWLLDRLEAQLDEPYRTALHALREGNDIEEELEKHLSLVAPGYRRALVDLAEKTQRITRSMEIHSELELVSEGAGMGTATHRFTGMWFQIGPNEVEVDFGQTGVRDLLEVVTDFDVHRDHGDEVIAFDELRVRLPYGRALDYVLNEVLAQGEDPFVDSLAELVSATVPCPEIGDLLATLIDKGSDELYAVACAAAIGELSKAVLPDKIKPITVSLSIEGDAILVDTKDGNRRADGLDLGQWHGTLAYPSTSLSLRRPDHVFTAERDTARSNNVER